MATPHVNIGLIGSGFMGQAHADAYARARLLYRDLPVIPHLFCLSDVDAASAQSAAERTGFEKFAGNWRELVTDPGVDVVDITAPNFLHCEMALAAIDAGKHVYCEKPLSIHLDEAHAMTAAAPKRGVKTIVAFNHIETPSAI